MQAESTRRGLTKIELLVIFAIVVVTLAIAIVAIQAARETARRNQCRENLKQLGLLFHTYHDMHKRLPPAADIAESDGKKIVGGWSCLARLVNMICGSPTHDVLDRNSPGDDNDGVRTVVNWSVREFICPSNPNGRFLNPATKEFALTNYKVMGATHIESLRRCIDLDSKPLYPSAAHPDGALYPGATLAYKDFSYDGTAHTVLCVETIDDTASVWAYGTDVTLVGLPTHGPGAVTFAKYDDQFWAPTGFDGKMGDDASQAVRAMRTFLDFDFRPNGRDAGTYPVFGDNQPAYGPSSGHPKVVNHLFLDGTVHSIPRDLDAATYMFLITRNGSDPYPYAQITK